MQLDLTGKGEDEGKLELCIGRNNHNNVNTIHR